MSKMMKVFIVLSILLCYFHSNFCQTPFILSLESPKIDLISDVAQISDTFYFIQNRITSLGNSDFDSFADLIVTKDDGSIIGVYNLNGFRTYYQRILKVVGDEIYLAGAVEAILQIEFSYFNI